MSLELEVVKGLNKKTDGLAKDVNNNFVRLRLNELQPCNPSTIKLRNESYMYVDSNSISQRVSLEKIKNMSTKIVIEEEKNLQELSVGDYVYE